MNKLIYFGEVTDGVLKIHNRKAFTEDIKRYNGKHVQITIERKKSKRSNDQNRYYWGVVVSSVAFGLKDAGYIISSNDEVHEFLKDRFLPKRDLVNEKTGEVLSLPASTASLGRAQMSDYIQEIKEFAKEYLNIDIPEAGEQSELKFEQ